MLDTLFGGGQEAAAKAMGKKLQEGLESSRGWMGQAQGALNPYINREQGQYDEYLNALRQGQNPQDLLNQYISQYRMSPEAQAQIAQGQQGANRAAAAGGMLGSGAEQTAAANLSQSVRTQDRENYLDRLFGLRNQYMGGLGGLQQQGYGASQNLAQMLFGQGQNEMQYYRDMANAEAAQKTGRAGGISGAIGAGVGLLGNAATGGLFGPAAQGFARQLF